MNIEIQSTRHYSIKSIFQDLLSLLFQQVSLVDGNGNSSKLFLVVDERQIEITILQLCQHIILIFADGSNKPMEIKFPAKAYLREQVSNSYRVPEQMKDLEPHFQNVKSFAMIQQVIRLRIKDFLQGTTNIITNMSNYSVLVFLDSKSLLNLALLNNQFSRIQRNPQFWFELFNFRYGRTGFGLSAVDWRRAYTKHNASKRKWVKP